MTNIMGLPLQLYHVIRVIDLEIETARLNDLIINGDTSKAMELFYAHNVLMQENEENGRVGKQTCLENEKRNLQTVKKVVSKLFNQAIDNKHNVVLSKWEIVFTTKNGKSIGLREVSVQHWDSSKIIEDKFRYKDFYPVT